MRILTPPCNGPAACPASAKHLLSYHHVSAGEEIAPQPSMDLPSPFADPLSSFLLSHSTAAADTGEPEPALHVNIKAPLPASSSQSTLKVAQVKVLVQPLQLQYQPSCFERLAKIVASPTGRSRTAELMDVITEHDSLEVQSLSVAELACSSKPMPAVSLEVGPTVMCHSLKVHYGASRRRHLLGEDHRVHGGRPSAVCPSTLEHSSTAKKYICVILRSFHVGAGPGSQSHPGWRAGHRGPFCSATCSLNRSSQSKLSRSSALPTSLCAASGDAEAHLAAEWWLAKCILTGMPPNSLMSA